MRKLSRFWRGRASWCVWEEDETGQGVQYLYWTRREVRKHIKRVRSNPFLKGWLVRGVYLPTGEPA